MLNDMADQQHLPPSRICAHPQRHDCSICGEVIKPGRHREVIDFANHDTLGAHIWCLQDKLMGPLLDQIKEQRARRFVVQSYRLR